MPRSGFTLIEMLVVIAIMAVIGIFTLSNYKSFGEDQSLKNAVLDIQSQLRTAQTNATTNLKCGTQYSATWQVEFADDDKTINLKCSASADIQKTLQLDTNIKIKEFSGTSCEDETPITIEFTPLSGKIGFIYGDGNNMSSSCISLTVTLKNTKTGSDKSLTIEKGGKIYAQ